ncbi:hypothetical protein JCGZ_03306 [Jatropha curcas]|uniref:Uncharacterized protein n=1 Tax=Jatropha curcas TaxID=180498 RepID=A0A067JNR0_JATCU|nr:hypothetical protein JCGZ_03306 [Jatropha curcas]
MAGETAVFKFLKPRLRPQITDIQAAAFWGVAATTTALWIIQPFNWIKKTFIEKEPEGNKGPVIEVKKASPGFKVKGRWNKIIMVTDREKGRELVELFEAARKAAGEAVSEEDGVEESRCLDMP